MKTVTIKKNIMLTLIIITLLMCSCGKKEEDDKPGKLPNKYIVVIDQSSTSTHKVKYNIISTTTKEAVDELFEKLISYKDEEYASPFSDKLIPDGWDYSDGLVSVYFTGSYYDLLVSEEVLIRAAIVETMCQLDGVDDVSFFVDDAPLTIQGNVIGRMNRNSFLYDVSGNDETTRITLYFPDMEAEGLVEVVRKVQLNARYTDEQMVLEELFKGPQSGDSGAVKRGVPSKTKLINVVTKDSTCYVNLSSEFLNYIDGIPDELTIYSIVNSLCEVAGVRSVEISVEGEKLEYYRTMPCNELLTVNYDILITEE